MPENNGSSTESPWVTKKMLAKRYCVSLRTIDNYMYRRVIPFVRITARCVRFRVADVDAALKLLEEKAI